MKENERLRKIIENEVTTYTNSWNTMKTLLRGKWIRISATIKKLEPRCPSIEEWIQKMWYIYTMGY